MESHIFSSDSVERWYDYYDRLPAGGTYHNPDYLTLLEGNFEFDTERAELYVLETDGEFVYYPYLKRPLSALPFDHPDYDLQSTYDIVSSWYYGGPLLSDPERTDIAEAFATEFSQHCQETGIVAEFIRFDPNLRNDANFAVLEPEYNRQTVTVDLTQSDESLWDGFEKRNRNAIRQAQDTELVVEPTTDLADYEAFYDIYKNAMEAKDASEHYRFAFPFFESLFDQESRSTLLVARHQNNVIGGSVVVHDETVAHDYLRASNPEYWDMRVNNFICYKALMHMRATGRERFDFQGGRPGVFKFKKSFSPDRSELRLSRQVHLPDVYSALTDAAENAGIETASSYFPAYRVEQSN